MSWYTISRIGIDVHGEAWGRARASFLYFYIYL